MNKITKRTRELSSSKSLIGDRERQRTAYRSARDAGYRALRVWLRYDVEAAILRDLEESVGFPLLSVQRTAARKSSALDAETLGELRQYLRAAVGRFLGGRATRQPRAQVARTQRTACGDGELPLFAGIVEGAR